MFAFQLHLKFVHRSWHKIHSTKILTLKFLTRDNITNQLYQDLYVDLDS